MSVLIIGGGVIGLSIARELHRHGFSKITVVDRGHMGREASWAAAGMLSAGAETVKCDCFYRFCSSSSLLYPQLSRELHDETGIDIELNEAGTIFIALREAELEELGARFRIQSAAEISVERLTAEEVMSTEPNVAAETLGGLLYPNDRQIENRKLIEALKKYAQLNGIRLVENVDIRELEIDGSRIRRAISRDQTFEADTTILATGAWTSLIKMGPSNLAINIKPIRGQMIAYEGLSNVVRHVIYSSNCYLVPRADGRLLVGATMEDVGFEKATTPEGVAALERAAIDMLPSLTGRQISDKWAGLRPFALDGLPVIGKVGEIENLMIATAHFRNGILLAPATAVAVADLISTGVPDPAMESFSPARFSNMAAQAYK